MVRDKTSLRTAVLKNLGKGKTAIFITVDSACFSQTISKTYRKTKRKSFWEKQNRSNASRRHSNVENGIGRFSQLPPHDHLVDGTPSVPETSVKIGEFLRSFLPQYYYYHRFRSIGRRNQKSVSGIYNAVWNHASCKKKKRKKNGTTQ